MRWARLRGDRVSDETLESLVAQISEGPHRAIADLNAREPGQSPRRVRVLLLDGGRVATLPIPGSAYSQAIVEKMWAVLSALRAQGSRPVFPNALASWQTNGRLGGFTREHIPICDPFLDILYSSLTVRDLLVYGMRLALGLHRVHRLGWAVRDLKPSNIGHRYCGSRPFPVVLDWDTLTSLGHSAMEERDDGTLTIVGTSTFITPEEVRGEPVVPQTDQMQLALVLLSTCVRWYGYGVPGEDERVSFLRASAVSYPYWELVREVLPGLVYDILRTAMSPDPRDRFADCLQFALALRGALCTLTQDELDGSAPIAPLRRDDYVALASPVF